MRKSKILYILIFYCSVINAQKQNVLEGNVSYVTSTNTYVKFSNTDKINVGDTLFKQQNKVEPLLIVNSKSSTSVVGKKIINDVINVGDKVFFIEIININLEVEPEKTALDKNKVEAAVQPPVIITEDQNNNIDELKPLRKKGYSGRITVSMNSLSYSGVDEMNNRLRTSFTFNTFHDKGLISSTQIYLAYRKNLSEENINKSFFDDLRVYNLAAQLKISKKDEVWIGRKINNYISNIGAIDGVQYDHQFSKSLTTGAFAGSRPDILDYGFNADLLQYGAYINYIKEDKMKYSQTSLAIANQMNKGNTDRRFIYLQHNSSVVKNLNFFGSIETDLYQNYNDTPQSIFRLTSLYASLRYKISKKISVSTSYDNRKNIVFFESNKVYIDSLIDNETRQGLRFQLSISPFKKININASKFYRYQEGHSNTDNTNVNLNYNRIPVIDANLSLNATTFNSSYIKSEIYGGRINRYFFKSKLQLELNYRTIKYTYPGNEFSIDQKAYGLNISYNIMKMMMINFNYEATKESSRNYQRYFITVNKRFKS